MKLKEVRVDGFRSVKEPLKLFVDPKVTILIGANDHGKTTLLEAVRSLNDDRTLTKEDENWDLVDQGKPILEFVFELDGEELAQLKIFADSIAEKDHQRRLAEATASAPPTTLDAGTEAVKSNPAVQIQKISWDYTANPLPATYVLKKGVGEATMYEGTEFYSKVTEAVPYLTERVPRIEL
jgi:hypothetical protein